MSVINVCVCDTPVDPTARQNSTDLAERGREAVAGGAGLRGEDLGGDDEGGGVGAEVLWGDGRGRGIDVDEIGP